MPDTTVVAAAAPGYSVRRADSIQPREQVMQAEPSQKDTLQATFRFLETEFGLRSALPYADGLHDRLRYDGNDCSVRADRDLDCVEAFLCWPPLGWSSGTDLTPGMAGFRPFSSVMADEDARNPSAVMPYPPELGSAADDGAAAYAQLLRAYMPRWLPPGAPPQQRPVP